MKPPGFVVRECVVDFFFPFAPVGLLSGYMFLFHSLSFYLTHLYNKQMSYLHVKSRGSEGKTSNPLVTANCTWNPIRHPPFTGSYRDKPDLGKPPDSKSSTWMIQQHSVQPRVLMQLYNSASTFQLQSILRFSYTTYSTINYTTY